MKGSNASQRVLCGREFQNSIRDSVHRLLCEQIDALKMNYIYEIEQATIKAREGALLPDGTPNKSDFIFKGFHNNISEIKSTEGIDICWIEEAKSLLKNSFEIIDPTVRKPGSEIWISFNPELETDFVYDHFVLHPPPNALVRKLSWRDNPWFNEVLRAQMEHMKATDFDAYLNVWEGECRLILEGAVYADELRAARVSGRICEVPHDPNFPVDVIYDLGKRDRTSMLFRQQVAYETRFIHHYSDNRLDVEDYIEYMQARRGYAYGTIWLPHDGKAKRLGSKKTIQEQFQNIFGTKNVRIVPRLGIADGISIARQGFRRAYFDKVACADFLTALSHYRYEVIQDGHGSFSREPVHDWTSHDADAFRYEGIVRKLGHAEPTQSARAAELQERIDQMVAEGHVHGGRPGRMGPQDWMMR
jgi:phage terminase large subunit